MTGHHQHPPSVINQNKCPTQYNVISHAEGQTAENTQPPTWNQNVT